MDRHWDENTKVLANPTRDNKLFAQINLPFFTIEK